MFGRWLEKGDGEKQASLVFQIGKFHEEGSLRHPRFGQLLAEKAETQECPELFQRTIGDRRAGEVV